MPPVLDRPQRRRMGRRAADLLLFQGLDQGGFRIPRRRDGLVAFGLDAGDVQPIALVKLGQAALFLGGDLGRLAPARVLLVAAFLIGREEAAEGDHRAAGTELGNAAVGQGVPAT